MSFLHKTHKKSVTASVKDRGKQSSSRDYYNEKFFKNKH